MNNICKMMAVAAVSVDGKPVGKRRDARRRRGRRDAKADPHAPL